MYPQVLYKASHHYTDWMQFCSDLSLRTVKDRIVKNEKEEAQAFAEGFKEAGFWMEPEDSLPIASSPVIEKKKRGMPKGGWPKKDLSVHS